MKRFLQQRTDELRNIILKLEIGLLTFLEHFHIFLGQVIVPNLQFLFAVGGTLLPKHRLTQKIQDEEFNVVR
jgi:hypothetical protein